MKLFKRFKYILAFFCLAIILSMPQMSFALANIYGDFHNGDQRYLDRSDNVAIMTLQSDLNTTYHAGLRINNDEGFIDLPITDAYAYNYSGTIAKDGTSSPGLATNDLCPSIVWANTEVSLSTNLTYAVMWTVTIPRDFRDGTDITLEIAVSSPSATPLATFEYVVLLNGDAVTFDTGGTGVPLTTVGTSANTALDVVSGVDTPDDLDAGDVITIALYLVKSSASTIEVKSARLRYDRQFNN